MTPLDPKETAGHGLELANSYGSSNQVKKVALLLVRVFFTFAGFGIIVLLFWGRWQDVLAILQSIRPGFVLFSFAVFIASLFVITFRLRVILSVQKVMISMRDLFYFGLVGHFFNVFLPSAVGGDAVKAYYTYKRSGQKLASFTSVFLDRVIGVFAILALAFVAFLLYGRHLDSAPIRNTFVVMLAGGTVVTLILFSRRVGKRLRGLSWLIPSAIWKEKLHQLYLAMHNYRYHKTTLLKAFLLSLLAQSVFIFTHYFLALSLDIKLSLALFFVLVPIIGLVSIVPSINGLGVREAAFVYYFSPFVSPEKALALSLVYDGLIYTLSFLFGLFYLMKGGPSYKEIKEQALSAEINLPSPARAGEG